jgi:hypothetical protein
MLGFKVFDEGEGHRIVGDFIGWHEGSVRGSGTVQVEARLVCSKIGRRGIVI